jgi:hypothetical protein
MFGLLRHIEEKRHAPVKFFGEQGVANFLQENGETLVGHNAMGR